jgi:hypothetical protein
MAGGTGDQDEISREPHPDGGCKCVFFVCCCCCLFASHVDVLGVVLGRLLLDREKSVMYADAGGMVWSQAHTPTWVVSRDIWDRAPLERGQTGCEGAKRGTRLQGAAPPHNLPDSLVCRSGAFCLCGRGGVGIRDWKSSRTSAKNAMGS